MFSGCHATEFTTLDKRFHGCLLIVSYQRAWSMLPKISPAL